MTGLCRGPGSLDFRADRRSRVKIFVEAILPEVWDLVIFRWNECSWVD